MNGRAQPRFFYGYVVVMAGFLILVVMYGTLYAFGVFLGPVLREFGWTRATTSGAYSLCFLLSGAVAVAAGRLSDRFGPRAVMSCSGLLLGLGYFLMARMSSVWELYLFYGTIVGVGMAGGIAPTLSTVARWFVSRRGMMTGMTVAGTAMGTLITPGIASQLVSVYDWRTSLTAIGVGVFILIVGLAQLLVRDPRRMGLLPDGVKSPPAAGSNGPAAGPSLRQVVWTGSFWMLLAIYLCIGLCIQIVIVHVTIHAVGLGFSPGRGASILSMVGVGSFLGRIVGGGVSDRFGNKHTMIGALVLMGGGFIWLWVARELWRLYLFALVFGFTYGEILCMMSLYPAELFGLKSQGAILGMVVFASTVGGSIGPVVAGRIFDITGSYDWAFMICTVATMIGLGLTLCLQPPYHLRGL